MNKNETQMLVENKLLKAMEVAETLNISKSMVYNLMKQGKIRTVSIGTARRVRPQDLEAFIEESLVPTVQLEIK